MALLGLLQKAKLASAILGWRRQASASIWPRRESKVSREQDEEMHAHGDPDRRSQVVCSRFARVTAMEHWREGDARPEQSVFRDDAKISKGRI